MRKPNRKELPKGIRKHIRTEKGKIRRENGGEAELNQKVVELYAKFGLSAGKSTYVK